MASAPNSSCHVFTICDFVAGDLSLSSVKPELVPLNFSTLPSKSAETENGHSGKQVLLAHRHCMVRFTPFAPRSILLTLMSRVTRLLMWSSTMSSVAKALLHCLKALSSCSVQELPTSMCQSFASIRYPSPAE